MESPTATQRLDTDVVLAWGMARPWVMPVLRECSLSRRSWRASSGSCTRPSADSAPASSAIACHLSVEASSGMKQSRSSYLCVFIKAPGKVPRVLLGYFFTIYKEPQTNPKPAAPSSTLQVAACHVHLLTIRGSVVKLPDGVKCQRFHWRVSMKKSVLFFSYPADSGWCSISASVLSRIEGSQPNG